MFAFSKYFGIDPAEIPTLALYSDVETVQCWETVDNTQFLVNASINTSQTLQYADSFKLTLDDVKYTPYLPLDVSARHLGEDLTDLVSWQCMHTVPDSAVVWTNTSFENETGGENGDAPRAFCGRGSKQNPRTIWENSEGMELHGGLFVGH